MKKKIKPLVGDELVKAIARYEEITNERSLVRLSYNRNPETTVTLGELAMEAKKNGIPANIAAWSVYLTFMSINANSTRYSYNDFLKVFEKVYK